MLRAEHSVFIRRDVSDVFAFVADQRNESRWHTDVTSARPQGPIDEGSVVTWVVRFMGENEYVNEVTTFVQDRQITMEAREGPLKPTLTHEFEASGSGTQYTRRVEIPAEGLFRVVEPLMKLTGTGRRRNARFAENLKELLEEPAAA